MIFSIGGLNVLLSMLICVNKLFQLLVYPINSSYRLIVIICVKSQPVITWSKCSTAKHKLIWLITGGCTWSSIIGKNQSLKMSWPIGLSVFSKPNRVRLNLSQKALPWGLYGEVNVCSTPYILHSAFTTLESKHDLDRCVFGQGCHIHETIFPLTP